MLKQYIAIILSASIVLNCAPPNFYNGEERNPRIQPGQSQVAWGSIGKDGIVGTDGTNYDFDPNRQSVFLTILEELGVSFESQTGQDSDVYPPDNNFNDRNTNFGNASDYRDFLGEQAKEQRRSEAMTFIDRFRWSNKSREVAQNNELVTRRSLENEIEQAIAEGKKFRPIEVATQEGINSHNDVIEVSLKTIGTQALDGFEGSFEGKVFATAPTSKGGIKVRSAHSKLINARQKITSGSYSNKEQRLKDLGAIERSIEVADYYYSAGDSSSGDFSVHIAETAMDVLLGVLPGVGWAKDCYEVITGRNLVTGEKLDAFDYGMAIVGAASLGVLSKLKYVKNANEAFGVIENIIKTSKSGEELKKALEVSKKAQETYKTMRKRLPTNRTGRWEGERGYSRFYPKNAEAKKALAGEGVPYQGMFPQFDKWVKQGDTKSDFAGGLDGSDSDFSKVYEWVAKREKLPSPNQGKVWLKKNGLTPHHVEDGKTIQLVPTVIHEEARHIGGASLLRTFGKPTTQ